MMKVLAINGSPRKGWNTAMLLTKALEGAASQGAETELVHLYDLNFKGCTSCFACKLKNGKSYGKCAYKDGLSSLLGRLEEYDALLIGSPIYLGSITGETKSFLERLAYPYLVYDAERSSLFPKKLPVGFIYTLGASEERLREMQTDKHIGVNQMILGRIFGSSESLVVTDTYQFDDYSKYVCSHDVGHKAKRRQEVFPQDCQKAFELGAMLVKN